MSYPDFITARSHAARSRGFTLLELVLASGLVAMLSLAIYQAMSVGFKTRGVVERQTSRMQVAGVVFDQIDRDLQSVMTLPAASTDGTVTTTMSFADTFTATESDVTFVTLGREPTSESVHADGPRRIRLYLDGTTLARQEQHNLLSPNVIEPEPEPLARNVQAFALSFYDGQTWTNAWDSASLNNALPLAVQTTITFDTGKGTTQTVRRTVPIVNGTDVTQVEATTGAGS